ncbi:DUF6701 domain-containing protein [Geopsychrobacter electrodiphilus]|uniref:DUF6701 domain-containing protein n=1 Tax=Geopsychrobacter electrodiphilus TaxID=225196 RepID=UPI000369F4B0|nr:DUF6701 domain-containing protein [Geopsychrobacter electrodiphilus]
MQIRRNEISPYISVTLFVRRLLILSSLSLLMVLIIPCEGHADRTITSVTLDGGNSVTVLPSATISATVNVTTDNVGVGGRIRNDWLSTAWRISTSPPGTMTCENHNDHTRKGNYSETFNITAPAASGTYNIYFIAYNNDSCSSGDSATFSRANAVVVNSPPSVVSITRAGADPVASNTTVTWTVMFSTSVNGVDSGDFSLVTTGGVSGATLGAVTGSGTTWTVSANTGNGASEGTLRLNLVDNDSIRDVATAIPLGGTGSGNGNFSGESYRVISPPTLVSILRASSDPTAANTTVAWTVVFSASVSGVDTGDFVLVPSGGTTGASLIAVSDAGGRTTWTVTANTGPSSIGTLGLNLVDNDSILENQLSQPLGGVGVDTFPAGPVYTLAPPAVVLNKTAGASAAVVGEVVTFTLTATNPYDNPLTAVVVTDTLPTGMGYVTHVTTLGTAAVAGQVITWTIPSLPAKGSAQLTLAVSLLQQGPLVNTVTSPGALPASATILVLASAVTHFRMDEPAGSWSGAAGEVIDSGGTALHGRRLTSTSPTTTNVVDPVPTISSEHPSVIGGFCNAAFFDGRAIVEVADSPLFDYTTQLSASAWIYPTAYPPSDYYSILSNDVNYEFHISPTGKLYWWWNSSTLTSATTIPLNQWTHVAITFDSSAGVRRQRIYINGVQDPNTNNWQGTLAPNNCNFYIGGDIATGAACSIMPGRNFHGMIDEVKLYSFELSPSEVVADMTLGRSCSGTFDHVQIEHDGTASVCAPERVTIKACLDSSCNTLYPGTVTVKLKPTGWVGGETFSFNGGIATRQLSQSTAGAVTLGTDSVTPAPATASRCFNGASETCTLNFTAASCAFDAVEVSADPQTPIFTKLAGVPFNIDVLALLGPTTINTTYAGTVAVDLVDASSSACPVGVGLTTATNTTFSGGEAGRKTVAFNYPNAARNVRVRATVGASAPACSTDNFAIRPTAFTLTSSDATNTATTGIPIIKAGTPFNLTASSVAGYDGTPNIDSSKLNGTPNAGVLNGSFGTAPAATGTAAGSGFSYSEVGHFGLAQNAVYDISFTAVDQPGDCTADYSNTISGGKYGCSFGSAAVPQINGSSGFGRFIPARFNLSVAVPPQLGPTCSNSFTYLGQPFGYLFDPEMTLTALNNSGSTTLNYGGSYWKMNSNLGGRSYTNNAVTAATLGIATAGSVAWAGTADSDGIGTVSISAEQLVYAKPTMPEAPFDANLDLNFTAGDLTDADGVCFDPENDGICNAYSISAITGTEQRYGRLKLQNAYGSELLNLPTPFIAEYFTGGGFSLNTADNCTTLTTADQLQLSTDGGASWVNGDTAVTLGGGTTSATLASFPLLNGDAGLSFSAPNAGNTGTIEVRSLVAPAFPWLLFDWTGDGVADEARARVTFGIYKGSPHLIYTRESVQ